MFGTLRAEHDFSDKLTGWAAFGMRRSDEANSLGNVTLTDARTGAGNFYRFDNTRGTASTPANWACAPRSALVRSAMNSSFRRPSST